MNLFAVSTIRIFPHYLVGFYGILIAVIGLRWKIARRSLEISCEDFSTLYTSGEDEWEI